jgi:WD40 repeat protein
MHDDRISIVRACKATDDMDFTSTGRVLVTACIGHQATFWDVETAREISTSIPAANQHTARFASDSEVWIGVDSGLQVWAFERDPADRNSARTRLAREIPVRSGVDYTAMSQSSRQIAAISRADGILRIFPLDRGGDVIECQGEPGMTEASFHPGGRFVATGMWRNPKGVCRVWDARTGMAVAEVGGAYTRPVFSSDGKLLAAGSYRESRIYATGSWQLLHTVPVQSKYGLPVTGGVAFSPDSSILAIRDGPSAIRLIDSGTADPLTTLESPCTWFIQMMRFSPDGRWLCASRWDGTIEFWDMHRLRQRLAEFGLDWTTSTSD